MDRSQIDRFLARSEASGLAYHTIRGYRGRLLHFAERVDGEPGDVTSEDIEDYLDVDLAALKLSSKRTALSELSAFFSYLHGRGKIPRNPCVGVKLASRPRKRPTYYTPEQAARLITGGTSPRNRLLAALALRHGQRAGAIVALRWEDIDFAKATITYSPWKTTRAMRLPLDLDTARLLKAWRALNPDTPWVFPGFKGGHLRYSSVRLALIGQCKAAGVPYRGMHELRRTCVTSMLQAGVPLHVVSAQVAGHSDVRTTVAHYAGADDEDVAAAIRRLPF